jgi:hypothetical protein
MVAFDLKGELIRKCRLVWRKETRIGVEFDESAGPKG